VTCEYRVREMGSLVPAPGMTVEVAHVTCADHADFPGWAGLAITQEVEAEDGTKTREVMSARLDLGAALLLANRLAAVVNAAAEPQRPRPRQGLDPDQEFDLDQELIDLLRAAGGEEECE
jgi:hypothetical protein